MPVLHRHAVCGVQDHWIGLVSVIIPTLNEEKALPLTLEHVLTQPGECEVIVVDGGSVHGTYDHAGVHWLSTAKGRASQMNVGAEHAAGEWLLSTRIRICRPER